MKKHHFIGLACLSVVFTAVLFFAGCGQSYDSNGERIYFTATSSSGKPVTYSGSIQMMHPVACVDCHGPDGKGGTVNMMMWSFDTPDITWDHLTTEEHQDGDTGEEHEEHPPYTEETVKQAITEGINPAGDPLNAVMPRWKISEQDLNDLLDYLKTLD